MTELSAKAGAVVTTFGLQPGVTSGDVTALQAVIASSSVLRKQINQCTEKEKGWLDQIGVMPAGSHMGGGFADSQDRLLLPLELVRNATKSPKEMAAAVFVMGHELQHAANSELRRTADVEFTANIKHIAGQHSAVHDYTSALEKRLAVSRKDEAMAHLSGWNAVVRYLQQTDKHLTLRDLHNIAPERMGDFIDVKKTAHGVRYTLKPGLQLNDDMTLSYTDANIEAMGKHFFDKSAEKTKIGRMGDSDYQNYYAAGLITRIVREEQAHAHLMQPPGDRLTLNMKRLGLSEDRLQHNGVDVGPGKHGVQVYFDSSTQPPRVGSFDETGIAKQHTPKHPAHPDHALYMQVRRAAEKFYGIDETKFQAGHENLVAGLYAVAKQQGFARVNHVFMATPQGQQTPAFYVSEWPPKHFPAHVAGLKQEQFADMQESQWFARAEQHTVQQGLAKHAAVQQQLQGAPVY